MPEEPCQCSDCQRFYKEHDRLIRNFQVLSNSEINWASIQSFRTLCINVSNELQRQLSEQESNTSQISGQDLLHLEVTEALEELGVNAYLHSIEALMERIFDAKISKNTELKFKEIANEIAPDPLNVDRLILNRLFHQTPDFPDKNNIN